MNTQPSRSAQLAELLCALSFATDLAMGQRMEHGLKTAYIGLKLADVLRLEQEDREAVFYGSLLKDAGCTACAPAFATFFAGDDMGARSDCLLLKPDSVKDALSWFWRHAPQDTMLPRRIASAFSFMVECRGVLRESVITHCEVSEMFAQRLGLSPRVREAVRFTWERWDGKGLAYGLKGNQIPIASRVLRLAQVAQVAHAFGGHAAAKAVARERQGNDFDPDLVYAFLDLGERSDFWAILELESAQHVVLDMRPASLFDNLDNAQVEIVCEVLADFADVKSQTTWNHSLWVADAAVQIARQMGLVHNDIVKLRRSALVHDIGKAAVPVGILEKGDELTPTEWERFRLHPYYTEQILAHVEPLASLTSVAIAHHERMDGLGYHRHLTGNQIPLKGRLLAVADAYVTLYRSEGQKLTPELVIRDMERLAGSHLDPDCYDALRQSLAVPLTTPHRSRSRAYSNLTERELDVLRLVAEGLNNRTVASTLVISEKTVESHLEHIFNKLGVSTRTSAAVFALHHGLLAH